MTTRTLIADRRGPVLLDLTLPAGAITVRAEPDRHTAEVTLTAHGQDPAVGDPVQRAVLRWSPDGGTNGGALVVNVPEVNSQVHGGGVQTVNVGGGIGSVTQILGHVPAGATVTGLSISGPGDIIIDGGRLSGAVTVNGVTVVGGWIEITARVPEGSRIVASCRAADLTAHGEYAAVHFTSTSGDLNVGGVGELKVKTVSGDVRAAAVDQRARVGSTPGNLRIDRADVVLADSVSGDISVGDLGGEAGGFAKLSTVSGDITVHATEGGRVNATSVSGDVRVTAEPAALTEGLTVTARSGTGHVTTPESHPGPTAVRPRRPRRS